MKKVIFTALVFIGFTLQLSAQLKKVKHVVLIGFDGLGAYAIPDAEMPVLKQLMTTGSWSLKARTVLPSSSADNWASMLMGAGTTLHGYTEWNSRTPEIPSAAVNEYGKFPGIFGLLRSSRPSAKTAVVYNWEGIGYLFEKEAVNIIVHDSVAGGDFYADTAAAIIKNEKPVLTFIHFSEPDGVGHSIGHHTPEYYAELKNVDRRIGIVLQAVKDAGIEKQTIVIISADHGGIKKGHGGKSLDEVLIPWIIKGPGVKPGNEITDVIITYDTAATIAYILGLKAPQAWRGLPVMAAFK